jgi:hypothetical protein
VQLTREGYRQRSSSLDALAAIITGGSGTVGDLVVLRPDGSTMRFRLRRTDVALGRVLVYGGDRASRPYLAELSRPTWEGVAQPGLLFYLKVHSVPRTYDPVAQGRVDLRDALSIMNAAGPGAKAQLRGQVEVTTPRVRRILGDRPRVITWKEFSIRNHKGEIQVKKGKWSGYHTVVVPWPGFSGMFNVTLNLAR